MDLTPRLTDKVLPYFLLAHASYRNYPFCMAGHTIVQMGSRGAIVIGGALLFFTSVFGPKARKFRKKHASI